MIRTLILISICLYLFFYLKHHYEKDVTKYYERHLEKKGVSLSNYAESLRINDFMSSLNNLLNNSKMDVHLHLDSKNETISYIRANIKKKNNRVIVNIIEGFNYLNKHYSYSQFKRLLNNYILYVKEDEKLLLEFTFIRDKKEIATEKFHINGEKFNMKSNKIYTGDYL